MTGFLFRAAGKQVLRRGQHFADAANEEIAAALATVLNGQVLLPDVPLAEQERIEKVLWA